MNAALLSRLGLWVLSTVLGSFGVLFVIASFGNGRFGALAFVSLATATAIRLALEKFE